MRINFLAEPSDPFRNQDVINSKLEVGMFVADMELPKRILRNARSLQDDVVERCIRALRFVLNLFLRNRIFRSAQIGYNLVSRLVELLPDHHHSV